MKKQIYFGIPWIARVSFSAGLYFGSEINYQKFLEDLSVKRKSIKVRYIPVNSQNRERKLNGELELYVTELDLDKDIAFLQDEAGKKYQLTYDRFKMKGRLEEIEED